MNVRGNYIHDGPKLETTQIFFIGRTDKYTVVHRHSGMLFSNKKEQIDWYMQQAGWISRALCWVKKVSLGRLHNVWFHLLDCYDSTRTTFSKGRNYRDGKEISGCQGLSGVAGIGGCTKGVSLEWWTSSVSWWQCWLHKPTHMIKYHRLVH